MTIDRRNLFRGLGPSLVTCRAGLMASFSVAVVPPYFIPEDEDAVNAAWLAVCTLHSRWHFDARTYPKHAFVRHEGAGLAYDIGLLDDERVGLIQLDIRCCPVNEDADPDLIVGHAACRVANWYWSEIFPSVAGACYVDFPDFSEESARIYNAPSLHITPVSEWRRG